VAVDGINTILVADQSNHHVRKIPIEGAQVMTWVALKTAKWMVRDPAYASAILIFWC